MTNMFARARRALAVVGVLAALSLVPTKASAAPLFFSWGGEKIVKVADYPDTPDYQKDGKHFDPGIRFKQITFFFLPIWNYDAAWCAAVQGAPDQYIDVTRDQLQAAGATLPQEPPIPAWDAYGGKIVAALLVGGYIFFRMNQSKKKPEPAATQPAAPTPPPGPTPPAS